MNGAVFMTGIDTGIGKTWVTAALVRALRARGIDAVGMKPVASGCTRTPHGWRNDDALALLQASELPEDAYDHVNPVALPMPASPHIAAADVDRCIDLAAIGQAFAALRRRHDVVLVEGVGGWAVPLSGPPGPWCMQSELVRSFDLRVLLVVGLRLGCINHALLSARAMAVDGCPLVGWLGNRVEPDWDQAGPVTDTLQALLEAPHLGTLDFQAGADERTTTALIDLIDTACVR